MSENLPSPRRQTHHHSNIHASFSASAFSFLSFFFPSFSDFLYFLFSFFMACDFFRFFFSIILIRFLCPRFLHYFICFETTCFVWFFDFLIACHSFPKKRKFRRRERTMPGGHGAVQSAEVGVMQIWFSFNIKNGGFLIRWLSFFRLTDALLTW